MSNGIFPDFPRLIASNNNPEKTTLSDSKQLKFSITDQKKIISFPRTKITSQTPLIHFLNSPFRRWETSKSQTYMAANPLSGAVLQALPVPRKASQHMPCVGPSHASRHISYRWKLASKSQEQKLLWAVSALYRDTAGTQSSLGIQI